MTKSHNPGEHAGRTKTDRHGAARVGDRRTRPTARSGANRDSAVACTPSAVTLWRCAPASSAAAGSLAAELDERRADGAGVVVRRRSPLRRADERGSPPQRRVAACGGVRPRRGRNLKGRLLESRGVRHGSEVADEGVERRCAVELAGPTARSRARRIACVSSPRSANTFRPWSAGSSVHAGSPLVCIDRRSHSRAVRASGRAGLAAAVNYLHERLERCWNAARQHDQGAVSLRGYAARHAAEQDRADRPVPA
jgi:hypothetical protein